MTPLALAALAFREDASVAAASAIETASAEKPSWPCFLILPVMLIFVLLILSSATNYSAQLSPSDSSYSANHHPSPAQMYEFYAALNDPTRIPRALQRPFQRPQPI